MKYKKTTVGTLIVALLLGFNDAYAESTVADTSSPKISAPKKDTVRHNGPDSIRTAHGTQWVASVNITPSKTEKTAKLAACIRKIILLNLDWDHGNPKFFLGFSTDRPRNRPGEQD